LIPGKVVYSSSPFFREAEMPRKKKLSETHKKNIGLANSGRIHTLKSRRHMSKAHIGLEYPDRKSSPMKRRVKKKISNTMKKCPPKSAFRKGHEVADAVREKISKATSGEKHYRWRGGAKSRIEKHGLSGYEWNKLRLKTFKRDKFICQRCGKSEVSYSTNPRVINVDDLDLHCHHIIPYSISFDNRMKNLKTLCNSCHVIEEAEYYRNLKRTLNETTKTV